MKNRNTTDRLPRVLVLSVAAAGVLMTGIASVVCGLSSSAARSVGTGALLAVINLWALARLVRALGEASAESRVAPASALLLSMKSLVLFSIVWLLLLRKTVAAGPLAIGYGALPIGVAIGALLCEKARKA